MQCKSDADTACIRIDIVCDEKATNETEIASILRRLAEKIEAGENPMSYNEALKIFYISI